MQNFGPFFEIKNRPKEFFVYGCERLDIISLLSKYSPQHPALKTPSFCVTLTSDNNCHTYKKTTGKLKIYYVLIFNVFTAHVKADCVDSMVAFRNKLPMEIKLATHITAEMWSQVSYRASWSGQHTA
jgi:hypothetical protein